jgi:hypothetical protein
MLTRVLVAALVAVAAAPAPARAGPYATFTHESFTLRLPGGWFVAEWKPAPNGRRAVPMKKAAAARTARVVLVADRRGNYLSIFVDHANDVELDAVWNVHPGADGAGVEVTMEGKPCDRATRSPTAGPCSQGNHTLEIGTLPPVKLQGHAYTFEFGNTEQEVGVSLDPFRWLLQGFRAR